MKEQQLLDIIREEIRNVNRGLVTEDIEHDDMRVIRGIIRNEVAAIFFSLFKKRKSWGA